MEKSAQSGRGEVSGFAQEKDACSLHPEEKAELYRYLQNAH